MRGLIMIAAIASAFGCTSTLATPLLSCPEMYCRSISPWGGLSSKWLELGCGRNAIAVEGIVADVQNQAGKCTRVVVSAKPGIDVPERLLIDIPPCSQFHGRVGGAVRGFVKRDPSDQNRFDAVVWCSRQ